MPALFYYYYDCEMVPGSARTASQMNERRPRVVKTYVERLQEMKQSSAPRHMMRTVTLQRESAQIDWILYLFTSTLNRKYTVAIQYESAVAD